MLKNGENSPNLKRVQWMKSHNVQEEQRLVDETIGQIERVLEHLEEPTPGLRSGAIDKAHLETIRRRKRESYSRALDNPYIGRLELLEDDHVASFRIGKVPVADDDFQDIIYDWRTPFGDVYYRFNGGDGEMTIQGPDGSHSQLLVIRKRSVHIRDRNVTDVRDALSRQAGTYVKTSEHGDEEYAPDLKDRFLAELWSEKRHDHQMREIIATIQKEQNEIIRLGISEPILVQGVAGSGKTSIALHRLSYMLYQYERQLSAENILVLAPNRMFLSYISEVVKELDITGVRQSTVTDFALSLLPKMSECTTAQYWLERFLGEPETEATVRPYLHWMTSLDYCRRVEAFIAQLEKDFLPAFDARLTVFGEEPILFQEKFKEIYDGYKHLPLNARRKETIQSIRSWTDLELGRQRKALQDQFLRFKKDWTSDVPDELVVKKELEEKLMELSGTKIGLQEQQWHSEVDRFGKAWKPLDLFAVCESLYRSEFSAPETDDADDSIDGIGRQAFFAANAQRIAEKRARYEDLGVLLLLQQKLDGGPAPLDYLMIDEAQDLYPFLLKTLQPLTKSMTLLGDITQSIHDATGFSTWDGLRETFGGALSELHLSVSYRSTREIMGAANRIVRRLGDGNLPEIFPIDRSGPEPTLTPVADGVDLLRKLEETILELRAAGKRRIAIIPKEEELAELLHVKLKDALPSPSQAIVKTEAALTDEIVFIPASHVKGLEFDAVVLPNVNALSYASELDGKLLFVSVTRAQEELRMFYFGEPSRFVRE